MRVAGRPAGAPAVVCRPRAGLANRLRALAACQALARHHHLPFAMSWETSNTFSKIPWNELFENPIEHLTAEDFEQEVGRGSPRTTEWFERPPGTSVRLRQGVDLAARFRGLARTGFCDDLGYINLIQLFKRFAVPRLEPLLKDQRRICREFRPARAVRERVDRFVRDHFPRDGLIGVHIRRGDAVKGPNREQYLVSSDQAFREMMEQHAPDARFFLATDCEQTENRFREWFGGRLLTAPKQFVPSEHAQPLTGQKDALVDLLLLSRSRQIIGTRWSSFGRMAATMGGVPFEVARCRI